LPTPTVAAGTIPRGAFVGSVHIGSVPRLFWWAELGRSGVPVDFLETDHAAAAPRPDIEYANLLCEYLAAVNFTRRTNGVPILTGRTIDTLLAGGLLLEEDSVDTRHFFQPGVHYLPFLTLGDLADAIPRLQADPDHRARMAAAGHAWATRYFSGDYFWAALLDRLQPA
jgi:hypothetical protein